MDSKIFKDIFGKVSENIIKFRYKKRILSNRKRSRIAK